MRLENFELPHFLKMSLRRSEPQAHMSNDISATTVIKH